MAKPRIDPAQAAAAMIANIDRVIQQVEQQVEQQAAPLRRGQGADARPARDALPPAPAAAPPAPPQPQPQQAPGGYAAPGAPGAPPQSEGAASAATGVFGGYVAPPPAPAAAAPAPAAPPRPRPLDDLDVFVSRLRQFKEWLQQDPRLLAVVDDYIGQRVQRMEARQSRQNVLLAIITTLAGAILGWVTSLAGTPATLLRLFGH